LQKLAKVDEDKVTNLPNFDRNGLKWRTASRSSGGNCVEVASAGGMVAIRHSRRPDAELILYSPLEFAAFVDGVRKGEFDDLCG
jgi:hypothetical protein